MKTVEIKKMPVLEFAHGYEADKFQIFFGITNKTIEISYMYEGKYTTTKGGKEYLVEEGDIMCILCDEEIYTSAESYHCHHTVGFVCDWKSVETPNGLYLPFLTKKCDGTKEVEKMIDDFIYNYSVYDSSPTKTAKGMLDILYKIDEINRSRNKELQNEYSILALRAKKYIHDNIHSPIIQAEVAKSIGVSTGHLCAVFKKHEGTTLIKYANALKLKNIRRAMKKERITLSEASRRYGYQDPNYVSLLYKRMFGHNITKPEKTATLGDA